MSTKLGNLIAKATSDPDFRFGALSHYITPEFLKDIVWPQMKKSGAGGVDGVTIKTFKKDLDHGAMTSSGDLRKMGTGHNPFGG